MTTFTLTATKLWRGGRKSGEVVRKDTSVNLTAGKDEIHLWFDQGGLERGTRLQIHIGSADFLTLVAAMGSTLNREQSQ